MKMDPTLYIAWTCLWPIAWSLVEYIDDKRLTMIGAKTQESNDEFDWFMLLIWIAGYFVIHRNS